MSMRIMARSSSNRNSASALASSVLPTPVGPRNRNEPVGRSGSDTPARARRTASDTACTARAWPITRCPISVSIRSSLAVSPSSSRPAGIPVQEDTTSATSSGPTSSFTMGAVAGIPSAPLPSSLEAERAAALAAANSASTAGMVSWFRRDAVSMSWSR